MKTAVLATLIASSLPIEEALAAVAQQSEKQHVSGLILGIRSKVLEGHSLASSLREYPGSFSELYCSSVAAGEQSGFLDRVLENLANYLERQFESSRNVEMALFYPVALLLLAFSIVGALMGVGWLARISDRKPSTMTPAWKAATAKYRAAQNQDPISNMS